MSILLHTLVFPNLKTLKLLPHFYLTIALTLLLHMPTHPPILLPALFIKTETPRMPLATPNHIYPPRHTIHPTPRPPPHKARYALHLSSPLLPTQPLTSLMTLLPLPLISIHRRVIPTRLSPPQTLGAQVIQVIVSLPNPVWTHILQNLPCTQGGIQIRMRVLTSPPPGKRGSWLRGLSPHIQHIQTRLLGASTHIRRGISRPHTPLCRVAHRVNCMISPLTHMLQ